jgi:hypothetical protein
MSSLRGEKWHGGEKGARAAAHAFYSRRAASSGGGSGSGRHHAEGDEGATTVGRCLTGGDMVGEEKWGLTSGAPTTL